MPLCIDVQVTKEERVERAWRRGADKSEASRGGWRRRERMEQRCNGEWLHDTLHCINQLHLLTEPTN